MDEVQIYLLGPFEVCRDFVPIPLSKWHNRWALKVLQIVLTRRPDGISPDDVALLVGGGIQPHQLPIAVEEVCRVLEPAIRLVQNSEGLITVLTSDGCFIDADEMEARFEAGVTKSTRGEVLPAMLEFQEADALYQGDLLEGISDPWVMEARRKSRGFHTEILERLADGHAVLGRYEDAITFCRKALASAPHSELLFQRMMVYHYYLGDPAGAEQAYLACVQTLQEVGQTPGSETLALWEQLTHSGLSTMRESAASLEQDPGDQEES